MSLGQRTTSSLQRSSSFPSPEIKTAASPFLFLALDLPPPPLFQDAVEKNIIPQVTLASLLAKYDGVSAKVSPAKISPYCMGHCAKCRYFVSHQGIRRFAEALQVYAFTALHHRALQAIHQERFRGGEEPYHRQLLDSRRRLPRW